MDAPKSLEAVQTRHRKEQRDLVARITQKKKSATKKTRKGVNDECDRLEQEQKERQQRELAELEGGNIENGLEQNEVEEAADSGEIANGVESLTISSESKAPTPDVPQQQSEQKKKPKRAKARLARRAAEQEALASQAAEEANNLPDLREQEQTRMKEHFEKHGLQEKEIRADGHCLYAAVADQMDTRDLGLKPRILPETSGEESNLPPYKITRLAAADFIAQNPDDFVPFMEEPLDAYLQKIRDTGEWGGHMELIALAKTYGININVLHGDGRVDKIESGDDDAKEREIWLGYYRHGFGLGEHYNSLRKKA